MNIFDKALQQQNLSLYDICIRNTLLQERLELKIKTNFLQKDYLKNCDMTKVFPFS